MFFSRHDKGEMASMVYNWEGDDVDAVVGQLVDVAIVAINHSQGTGIVGK